MVEFALAVGTLKWLTAPTLRVAFTNTKNRWIKDAMIGVVFVVCVYSPFNTKIVLFSSK